MNQPTVKDGAGMTISRRVIALTQARTFGSKNDLESFTRLVIETRCVKRADLDAAFQRGKEAA